MAKVVYGVNPVLEVLKVSPEKVEEIWIFKKSLSGNKYQRVERARNSGIPVKILSKSFNPPGISSGVNTQGVVAYLKSFDYADLEDIVKNWESRKEVPLVVALDHIEDPQNLGSIIRSSCAGGVHGIVIPARRSAEVTETVIKVSSGTVFKIPVVRVKNLKHALSFFRKKGLWILGLTQKAETLIYNLDLRLPLLVIAGNEAKGIRRTILEKCDFLARIPMREDVESLNVGVATAITIFEILRQRKFSEKF